MLQGLFKKPEVKIKIVKRMDTVSKEKCLLPLIYSIKHLGREVRF